MSDTAPEFHVGQQVYKPKGYPFQSTIVALFEKLDGEVRVVCESHAIPGMLHIFAPTQLAPLVMPEWASPWDDESVTALLDSLNLPGVPESVDQPLPVESDDLDEWAKGFQYAGGTLG